MIFLYLPPTYINSSDEGKRQYPIISMALALRRDRRDARVAGNSLFNGRSL